MTPHAIVAAERKALAELRVVQSYRACEYHGRVLHGFQYGQYHCIPCASERVDSMADALGQRAPVAEPEAGEPGYRCPSCGELYDSKMRTPADAVCFACRYASVAAHDVGGA